MDGWTSIMYNMFDAEINIIAAIYFCSLIILGSNFLINLILAVILDSFTKVQKNEIETELKTKLSKQEQLIK